MINGLPGAPRGTGPARGQGAKPCGFASGPTIARSFAAGHRPTGPSKARPVAACGSTMAGSPPSRGRIGVIAGFPVLRPPSQRHAVYYQWYTCPTLPPGGCRKTTGGGRTYPWVARALCAT